MAQARRETLRDKLARKLEEHADEVVAAYLAGIRSNDPNRAYRAADAWISRVHGRPKETIETNVPATDPFDVAAMPREERTGWPVSWQPSILSLHAASWAVRHPYSPVSSSSASRRLRKRANPQHIG